MTLPILMVVLVIGLYGYIGGDVTASMAFTTISLMEMVRRPLMMISWILNSVFVDGECASTHIVICSSQSCCSRVVG